MPRIIQIFKDIKYLIGILIIIIPVFTWLYGHFAKASDLSALECRTSRVVNELTQNVAKIQSENEIKKLIRKVQQIETIPLNDRTKIQKEELERLIDDKIFYKGLLTDIKKELELIAKNDIKDPCEGKI